MEIRERIPRESSSTLCCLFSCIFFFIFFPLSSKLLHAGYSVFVRAAPAVFLSLSLSLFPYDPRGYNSGGGGVGTTNRARGYFFQGNLSGLVEGVLQRSIDSVRRKGGRRRRRRRSETKKKKKQEKKIRRRRRRRKVK